MDNDTRNYRPVGLNHCYPGSSVNTNLCSGAEYGSDFFYSEFPGQGQSVSSIGAPSIGHLGATLLEPPFDTPLHPDSCVDGYSFHSHQQSFAHAIPRQILSCDYASQTPTKVNGNVLCGPRGNQDTGTYTYPHYPAPSARWDAHIAQAVLGPKLSTTDNLPPPCVAPSLLKDKGTNMTFKASAPKRPAHGTDNCCPICPASLGRLQDRKRHKLSHLPHWLQCPDPGCSWRGDRWENLKKHHLKAHKVHPSSSQEPDKCKSVIYDPWPLVEGITDNTTLVNARKSAIILVEKRAIEVGKSGLWEDFWGRRKGRKARKCMVSK